jgi:hypothetical protein
VVFGTAFFAVTFFAVFFVALFVMGVARLRRGADCCGARPHYHPAPQGEAMRRRRIHAPRRTLLAVAAAAVGVCAPACVSEVDLPGDAAPNEPVVPVEPLSEVPGCEGLTPSPVPVLPRTSTNEFARFVEDLLGAPVAADAFSRWTPLAKVWGFDTMTEARIDAQTFDAMWETTEDLAVQLARSPRVTSVCPAPTPVEPVCARHDTYDAIAQFSGTQGADCWSYLDGAGQPLQFVAERARWEGRALIWNNGLHPGATIDVIRRWTAPLDGTITIRGTFTDADPGGGDGVHVVVKHGATELFRDSIPNGSAPVSLDAAFAAGVAVARGDTIDFVVEPGSSDIYDTTGLTLGIGFVETPSTAGLTWENCAAPALAEVASRAYRRPLRAGELSELKQVFDATVAAAAEARIPNVFHEGLTASLQAVLLSPHVHYKPELVPGGFSADEEHHRRAARLALYFRSSFPDDALRGLALRGGLGSEEALVAEATRLLQTSTPRFADDFAGQWLDFRPSLTAAPETPLQQAMRQEAAAVFSAVLLDGLPPSRLIDPGFTIVDDSLAAFYGLPASGRVETRERGGLFTQGHFLTSTARGTDFRRVIHRGLWTLTRAMCQSVPPLDPATREEINGSVGQIDPAMPLSEQMQIHRNSSQRCNGCHALMDPLGLALERYDAQGQPRDTYPDGSTVDNDFDFFGTSMKNPDELAAHLVTSGDFERCAAEKLFTFGLHRAPTDAERCVVDAIAASPDASLRQMTIDAFVASLRLTEQP